MGCCGGRRKQISPRARKANPVMGGYGYLPAHQIRARLEAYKRINCKNCEKRYECDYNMYLECQKYKI